MNPIKELTNQFLVNSRFTILAMGVVLSLIDFGMLYWAAAKEGVLHIDRGVGLLQNYGLFSTVLGNALFPYLAKTYYDAVGSIKKSKALTDPSHLEAPLSELSNMVKMEGKYKFLIYLLIVVGAIYWASNVGFHVIGNPEIRWGHEVFDSFDHKYTFLASRAHNIYTWLIMLPLLGHVMIYTSIQLRKIMGVAIKQRLLHYDLLNPDQKGGFLFVENAHLVFNAVVAIVYIQTTMFIETFNLVHTNYVIAYIVATILLIGVNRIFLGHVYSAIKVLRLESLNTIKENVIFKNDGLGFEVLKYYYGRKINGFSVLNFAVKAGAIALSGAPRLWPILSKAFTGA